MPQKGICSVCNRGPRDIGYRHPETKRPICLTCYLKATGKKNPRKKGICSECGEGPKIIGYLHPKTKQNICNNCYSKIKRRERGLRRVPKKTAEPLVKRENSYRKNLYPTKESVEEALEARAREGKKNTAGVLIKEDASLYRKALDFKVELPRLKRPRKAKISMGKKPVRLHRTHRTPAVIPSLMIRENAEKLGRKLKYPTRIAVIAALEDRKKQGEENFSSVLQLKDVALYRSAQRFEVELPTKKNLPVIYYFGDLVKNRNRKDPDVYGRIGKVVESSKKETRVNFKERGGVTRVYREWENLNNIALYVHLSSVLVVLMKVTERETVLV